jgi:formate dehydrogenase major subunit
MNALEFLLVQDLFYTKTAELADIVLPAAAGAFESEGTVTSSERCVQRERCTVPPPVGVRDDLEIIFDLARRPWP